MMSVIKSDMFLNVLNLSFHFSESSLEKKKKLLLIIYSPPCHPRYQFHSFFSRKEIEVFDENIPEFFSI